MSEVAVVTSGERRLGRAIVERLSAAGYAIAIHCDSARDEAEALARAIERSGGRAAVIAADLAEPDSVAALMPAAEAALGPVTLLVNSASSFLADDVTVIDVPTWNRQFAINLRAPSVLAGALANRLPEGCHGAIVNIIDQRVWKRTPQYYSYTLTKAALLTATKTMAQALAPRVRVNAVGPGPTLQNAQDDPEAMEQEAGATRLQRPIDVSEIAEAVLYLARARSVTGQMVAIDGGQHLGWRPPDIVA